MSAPTPNNNNVEYLELTSDSLAAQKSHAALLLDIEARKRASTVDVPTLPADVRDALRKWDEPVRLFGEDLAAIRDRLRTIIARYEVWRERQQEGGRNDNGVVDGDGRMALPLPMRMPGGGEGETTTTAADEITETAYTRATPQLIDARRVMCDYSLGRSRSRLDTERRRRRGMIRWTRGKKRARLFDRDDDEEDEDDADDNGTTNLYGEAYLKEESALAKALDDACDGIHRSIRDHALEGSQYGDVRPLSAVCTSSVSTEGSAGRMPKIIATGGWSGGIKIWNGGEDHRRSDGRGDDEEEDDSAPSSSAPLDLLGAKNIVHEDRIMGIAMRPYLASLTSAESSTMVATASIDLTAKLCRIKLNEGGVNAAAPGNDSMEVENLTASSSAGDNKLRYDIEECAHLRGHAARLCSVAFHPTGRYVATTSFDHTWRLWDVETSSSNATGGGDAGAELMLQDGHAREVYGVGFHPDGSLVSTTDFGGVVRCWDLRTGKSACHFLGHAGRVTCCEFGPNGFQLATAGDDGTIKIWDLRRRRPSASIPAHTNLITQLKFAHSTSSQNGEFLASSSFDGTGKIWSTRDWKMLTMLQGHEGKVMGIDVLDGPGCGIVTCGYDKTLKLWQ